MAVILHIFRFPSYAGTSPMRITTVHSVHLPFFLKYSINPAIITFPAGFCQPDLWLNLL